MSSASTTILLSLGIRGGVGFGVFFVRGEESFVTIGGTALESVFSLRASLDLQLPMEVTERNRNKSYVLDELCMQNWTLDGWRFATAFSDVNYEGIISL